MTTLPTNPTKIELIERHWFEFLQWCNSASTTANDDVLVFQYGYENLFWKWYREHKMPSNNQQQPESN